MQSRESLQLQYFLQVGNSSDETAFSIISSIIVCFTAGVSFARIAEREMLCFNCLLISNNGFYKLTALLKAASVF